MDCMGITQGYHLKLDFRYKVQIAPPVRFLDLTFLFASWTLDSDWDLDSRLSIILITTYNVIKVQGFDIDDPET